MKKTAEQSVITEYLSRYTAARNNQEKFQVLMEVYSMTGIENYLSDEHDESLRVMLKDFYYPRDAHGKVDPIEQEKRMTIYSQWIVNQKIALGRRIQEFKQRFDRDYPGAGKDDKKRENNLLLAVRYGFATVDGLVASQDAMFKFVVGSLGEGEDGEETEQFNELAKKTYASVAGAAKEQDLLELGTSEVIETPYTEARFNADFYEAERNKYYKGLTETEIGRRYLGNREFDPNSMIKFSAWSRIRRNKQLEEAVQKLADFEMGSHKNSPLYQGILDTYDKVVDAKNPEEFEKEMINLQAACREYMSKRHPISEDGKKRLEYVGELENLITNTVVPDINEWFHEEKTEVVDPFVQNAQQAVLRYELRANRAYKENDPSALNQEIYRKTEKDILEGKNTTLAYILRQPKEIAEKMIEEIGSGDGKDRQHFSNISTGWQETQAAIQRHMNPAEAYIKGMFAPKTDPSDMRNYFHYGSGFSEMPGLNAVQQEADAIILPVPEGLSEEEVSMITLSFLASDENMADSFNRASGEAGSTLFSASEAAEAGFSNFLQNQLVMEDERANMNLPRLYLPEARRNAAVALHDYENKNYTAVATNVKHCFDQMLASARATQGIANPVRNMAGRFANSMYGLLSKPEFAGLVEFTEDEKEYLKLLNTEHQIVDKMLKLKQELIESIEQRSLQEGYLESDISYLPSQDSELMDKFREYQAYVLYCERCDVSNMAFDNAVDSFHNVEEIPTNTKKADAMKNERPISRIQKNMLVDPEGYIKYLKRDAGQSKDFLKLQGAKNWREAARIIEKSRDPLSVEKSFNIEYRESLGLVGSLASATDKFPETKEAEALKEELLQLPCCKDPVGGNTLSPKEMNERADIYEKMIEKVSKHSYPFKKTLQLPDGNSYERSSDAAQDIVKALKYEVECLRASSRLAVDEIIYEHAIAPSILSVEQAEQRIDEERQAVEEAANRIEEYRYGRPNKEIYRDMLVELVNKAEEHKWIGEVNLQVIQGLSNSLGSPTESLLIDKMPAVLEAEMDKLSEKMLDDDSPELMQEYSVLANISSYLDAYMEASVIEEAEAEDSVYAKAYDNTGRRLNEIETVLSNINKETYPQFYELATRAKISINNIREAISNEAHGITTRNGVELGVAGLQNTDDLATLAAFYALAYSRADSSARVVLEDKGADLFIHKVNGSHKMQIEKRDYNIQDLNEVMEDRKNFSRFLLGGNDEVTHEQETTAVKQQGLNVVKDESPVNSL